MGRLLSILALLPMLFAGPSYGEDSVEEKSEQSGGYFKNHLKIGGWFDILLLDQGRGYDDFFNLHHFYVTFNLSINDAFSLFTEMEYANVPELNGYGSEKEFEIERAYLEYKTDQSFRLRLGKFHTPAGIWKPTHWSVLVDTITLPIMEQNDYIPTSSVGVELFGRRFYGQSEFNYSFLASIGTGDDLGESNANAEAFGGDFRYIFRERYTMGVSLYNFQDVEGQNGSVNGILAYADVNLPNWRLLWRTEFLTLTRSETPDIKAFYTKLKYQINRRLYLNYRFDRADDENIEPKGDEQIIQTLTVGFWPKNFLRFKLEYADHKFENDLNAYNQYAAWMGFVF